MRPLAVLLGIVMGSTVSIAAGLGMTLIVFMVLRDQSARLADEFVPLLRYLAWTSVLAGVSVLSFYGELRNCAWRYRAHIGLLVTFVVVFWVFWPRKT